MPGEKESTTSSTASSMVMAYQTVDEDSFGFCWPIPWQEMNNNGGCTLQWPKILEMSSMTVEKMIEMLRLVFATLSHVLPEQVVSNSGLPFNPESSRDS